MQIAKPNFRSTQTTLFQRAIVLLLASACVLTACEPQPTAQPLLDKPIDTARPASQAVQAPTFAILNAQIRPVAIVKPACDNACPEVDLSTVQSNYPIVDEMVKRHIVNYVGEILQGFEIEVPSSSEVQSQAASSPVTKIRLQRQQASSTPIADNDLQLLQQHIDQFYQLVSEAQALGSSHKLNIYVKPQILNPQGPVATVVMNASHFLGGAHGSSAQHYLNFDLAQQQMLSLEHILQSGKRKAFNDVVFRHYQQWVKQTQPDIAFDEYQKMWSFQIPENFFLSPQGLILQYGEYEIAPYAMGLPSLTIPYQDLQGILKKSYLPKNIDSTPASQSQSTASAPAPNNEASSKSSSEASPASTAQ